MPLSRLEYLFTLFINHKSAAKETEELMGLLAEPQNEAVLQALIDNVIKTTGSETEMEDQAAGFILQNILLSDKEIVVPLKVEKKSFKLWKSVAAAAIFIFLSSTAYLFFERKGNSEIIVNHTEKQLPVTPGGDKATLILSDGSSISLDSTSNEIVTGRSTAHINKQNGALVYNAPAPSRAGASVVYNTLNTPRGGQYSVVLPDGSKVWLNAASSLRFPTSFPGNQRVVQLTGEAYFEVAKNKHKPFHIKVGEMQIEVLGTHFNVNAYAEEDLIKTTLLEGSVKITKGLKTDLLKPGQQAVLNVKQDRLKINKADMDKVMAWKNGLFEFEGADITTILGQIGRWYDVEIVFQNKVPARHFQGKISRNAQLSDVLQILELCDVKISWEGKKIIVQ